jgi:hypothetical protein
MLKRWNWENLDKKRKFMMDSAIASTIALIGAIILR